MLVDIILALLLGSFLNLDRQSFGQNLLGRPLMTGFVIGHILGLTEMGLSLGLFTELFWLTKAPLGGFIIPNGGLAVTSALISESLVLYFFNQPPSCGSLQIFAFILVPPLAHGAIMVESQIRSLISKQVSKVSWGLSKGRNSKYMWYNLKGLFISYSGSLLFLILSIPIVILLTTFTVWVLPLDFRLVLNNLSPLAPLVGLILLASNLKLRQLALYGLAMILTVLIFTVV
jgi:mannose/fructose/N-acetylgalactosamine-specific phosphotransferase system component IIC